MGVRSGLPGPPDCRRPAHRGVVRQKPLGDGNVVVGDFPRGVLAGLCLPEQRVQVREVVVDVDAVVGPASQGPASQLRALGENSE